MNIFGSLIGFSNFLWFEDFYHLWMIFEYSSNDLVLCQDKNKRAECFSDTN